MRSFLHLLRVPNFIIFFIFIIVIHHSTYAQSQLDTFWKTELLNRNLKVNNTSYCFIDREGKLQGHNISKNFPIASLSKIITSLASLRFYGDAYHQFTTTVYYSQKHGALHFESNGDPTFNDEKLWLILSKLNENNIMSLSDITFNSQFYFMPHLLRSPHYEHQWVEGNTVKVGPYIPSVIETEKFLNLYLNTSQYNATIKKQFAVIAEENSNINKDLKFNFDNLSYRQDNPLIDAEDVQKFEITSPPLINILKTLNSVSNNPMADILYYSFGGESIVLDSLRGILPADDLKKMKWYTGSGLPLTVMDPTTTKRNVNLLSCKGMLFVKDHFRHLVDALSMSDFFELPRPYELFSQGLLKSLPVSGREGTISSYRDFINIFVGKTGTLNEAKMLSTFISANSGIRLLTMMGTAPHKHLSRLSDTYKLMLNQAIKAFSGANPFEYSPQNAKIAIMEAHSLSSKPAIELLEEIKDLPSFEQKIMYLINNSNCVKENCLEIIRSLLKKNLSRYTDDNDDPLLLHAIVSNKTFLVKELLDAGFSPNHKIYKNQIPLFFLSVHQDLEMVKTVLEHASTNIQLKNALQQNVKEYAQKYSYSTNVKNYFKLPNL